MRFDSYHPALSLLFFAAVIAFSAWWSHPLLVAVSFLCASAYSIRLNGMRAAIFDAALIPLAILYAAVFATNVHFGVTNMGQTLIGNNVTLESAVCGLVIGMKVASVLVWLSCVFAVLTADKVVYLVGCAAPKLSLFLAVALRAVPVVKDRARKISLAQSGVGKGPGQGAFPRRCANAVRRASILISWSVERFMQMSDSMRGRGVRLRGRTSFSLYRFDNRDRALVVVMVALITVCLAGTALDQTRILYSPVISVAKVTGFSVVLYSAFAAFCLMPLALQTIGEIAFRRRVEKRAHKEAKY